MERPSIKSLLGLSQFNPETFALLGFAKNVGL